MNAFKVIVIVGVYICPGFQNQGGSPTPPPPPNCVLCHLFAMGFLDITSGVTPADLLVGKAISIHALAYKHWWDWSSGSSVALPHNTGILFFLTARKRNLGQGHIFTHVCPSVHGRGGG